MKPRNHRKNNHILSIAVNCTTMEEKEWARIYQLHVSRIKRIQQRQKMFTIPCFKMDQKVNQYSLEKNQGNRKCYMKRQEKKRIRHQNELLYLRMTNIQSNYEKKVLMQQVMSVKMGRSRTMKKRYVDLPPIICQFL